MEFSQYQTDALLSITNRPPLIFTEGHGMWLTDHAGKRYLDYLQGWAVNCLGHSPQCIQDALAAQAKKLINPSPAFYNAPSIELASLLVRHSCFDRVFFASSGAEANEGAIKLARKWGKKNKNSSGGDRYEIITFDHSFHGRTLATMSASGKPGWDTIFAPQVPGFPKAVLNDLDSVEKLITDKTVAVMLEPVQGEGGVIPATREFMQSLRAFTKQRGLLLIVDEVQTGMGRTGKLWGVEHWDVAPDIITSAKALGGGVMPIGAFMSTPKIWSVMNSNPFIHTSTTGGNPLACAAAIAAINVTLEESIPEQAAEKGEYFIQQLQDIAARHSDVYTHITGKGLLIGQHFVNDDIGYAVASGLFKRGVLISGTLNNSRVIRVEPPLVITREEIDTILNRLEDTLQELHATVSTPGVAVSNEPVIIAKAENSDNAVA